MDAQQMAEQIADFLDRDPVTSFAALPAPQPASPLMDGIRRASGLIMESDRQAIQRARAAADVKCSEIGDYLRGTGSPFADSDEQSRYAAFIGALQFQLDNLAAILGRLAAEDA